jgi:hypothetical protein
MNIYGENSEAGLTNGGEVDGDLEIKGDLEVASLLTAKNLTVTDTLTATTAIFVDELKISDALIDCGVGNPSDNLNLGLLQNYNTGGVNLKAGIVRSKDDGRQYILNDCESVLPSFNLSFLPRGGITMSNLECSSATVGAYALPTDTGTSGQVLTTDGIGNCDWEAIGGFDQSLNTTDDVEFKSTTYDQFKIESTGTLNITGGVDKGRLKIFDGGFHFWERSDDTTGGVSTRNYKSRGTLTNPTGTINGDRISRFVASSHDGTDFGEGVVIECDTTQTWTGTAHGSEYCIATTDNNEIATTRKLLLNTSGVNIGDSSTGYRLPYTRGTDEQVLKTNGAGVVTWQDTYDQPLNTTDNVEFATITTGFLSCAGTTMAGVLNNTNGNVLISGNDTDLSMTSDLADTNKISFYKTGSSDFVEIINLPNSNQLDFSFITNGPLTVPLNLAPDGATISKLTVGGPGSSYTLPSIRGTVGQVLQETGGGVVEWVTPTISYGSQNITANTTATPIPVQGTFYTVEGTRVSGLLKDFTSGTNGLTYTGDGGVFDGVCSITWAIDNANQDQCAMAIFVNGVSFGLMEGALDDNNAYPRNCTTNALFTLVTGDVIDLRVANLSGTDGILVRTLSLSVNAIEDAGTVTSQAVQTMQQTFDASSVPQITTVTPLTLRGSGGSNKTLAFQDSVGVERASINNTGLVSVNGFQNTGSSVFEAGTTFGTGSVYQMPVNAVGMSEGSILTYDAGSLIFKPEAPAVQAGWSSISRLDQRTIENNGLELRLTFGMPNLTIPANTLKAGDSFKITSTGLVSATNVFEIATYRLKLGGGLGTLVAGGFPFALGVGNSLQFYTIETLLTVRSVGGSGQLVSVTTYNYGGNLIGQSNTSTINTTVSQAWSSTWQWSNTEPSNKIQQEIWISQKIV